MNNSTKILYDHLKDYPTSTEGYHEIGNRSVAAALCAEHMPDLPEASPKSHFRVRGGLEETTRQP